MTITINGTTGIAGVDGSAGTPAVQGADTNTGVFFPAADTIAFAEGGAEAMRIDSSGNVGIGTSSPARKLTISGSGAFSDTTTAALQLNNTSTSRVAIIDWDNSEVLNIWAAGAVANDGTIRFLNGGGSGTERMRITSDGYLLVGTTNTSPTTNNVNGFALLDAGTNIRMTATSSNCLDINRKTDDGNLVVFRQDGTIEGTISVSGTTVSYNGGHLSRYAQTAIAKDESLKKGTILSNLDEMNVYTDAEGSPVENEQLNKVKVSDVEGDANVAGVFVNWDYDEAHQVDEINMAMTGDMIIRIAQGVVVQKGDLLMSAGDGTAKPQGDDIVRSKTVAKVTSNHVTCTYEDGSYCVPCVLMAC
jgi:hypothetical protein